MEWGRLCFVIWLCLFSVSAMVWTDSFTKELEGEVIQGPNRVPHIVPNAFWSPVTPTPFTNYKLVHYNLNIANALGIDQPLSELLPYLAGASIFPNSQPFAHNYAGHQFGYYSPQLGDGRAVSLGEVVGINGKRWELQLKGAGKTPYSRQGDGRAVLRSSVREYLASVAMDALGIRTTQALSIVTTTDTTTRDEFYDGNITEEPMAMVLRVAPSFIRFGSFERFFYLNRYDLLEKLANYTITHHFPEFIGSKNRYVLFFEEVVRRTAEMMAHWISIGFAHGVMNTDNMSILGLTIDYGPFAFLDKFDPEFVPNTSDEEGRYAFGKQMSVARWNLNKLGVALSPLFSEAQSTIVSGLKIYEEHYKKHYHQLMMAKLGLSENRPEDEKLLEDLLQNIVDTDYSIFFRLLANIKKPPTMPTCGVEEGLNPWGMGNKVDCEGLEIRDLDWMDTESDEGIFWVDPQEALLTLVPATSRPNIKKWLLKYVERLSFESHTDLHRKTAMDNINPKFILRNWMAQVAITKSEQGDYSEVEKLMVLLSDPFAKLPQSNTVDCKGYFSIPPTWSQGLRCSCSS